jgi:hypothetical protein
MATGMFCPRSWYFRPLRRARWLEQVMSRFFSFFVRNIDR